MTELQWLQALSWFALAIWFLAGPIVVAPMVRAAMATRRRRGANAWIIGNLIIAAFNVLEAGIIAWVFQWPPSNPELRRYLFFVIPVGLVCRAAGFFLIGIATIGFSRILPWRRRVS